MCQLTATSAKSGSSATSQNPDHPQHPQNPDHPQHLQHLQNPLALVCQLTATFLPKFQEKQERQLLSNYMDPNFT